MSTPEPLWDEGLYSKYIVLRTSDKSVVSYPTFILRIDGTDKAAIAALHAYALATRNMELKKDLMGLISRAEADRAERGEVNDG